MITRSDIHAAIAKNVIGYDLARITSDEENLLDAGLDSLDHSSILLSLEEDHGVSFPDEIAGDLTSIKAILEYANKT